MRPPTRLQAFLLCLSSIGSILLCASCSPRDFLTRRLSADLISASDVFKAPQLFWLKNGVVSNKDFSSPDMMVLKRRGWIIGNEQNCPNGISPPPCWDVVLTPLGVDTIRPLISSAMPDNGMIAIQAARREMVSISGINKAANSAEVEFVWHWVSLNQVGAALYDSGVHFRSSVAFRKYDDGWHVVERNVSLTESLDEALRNAQPTAP